MFSIAARTLANMVTEGDLAIGRIYPDLKRIREVSAAIAVEVADNVFKRGLSRMTRPAELTAYVESRMYDPKYPNYV
jgi:malate dehydrogenase (oxaloacetate-decarboxylating)(NADP+)